MTAADALSDSSIGVFHTHDVKRRNAVLRARDRVICAMVFVGASSLHALSQTRFPIALLVRRHAFQGEGGRLQDHPCLFAAAHPMARAAGIVRREAHRFAGMGLGRHLLAPQMYDVRSVGSIGAPIG